MNIDKEGYYPYMPGSGGDDEEEERTVSAPETAYSSASASVSDSGSGSVPVPEAPREVPPSETETTVDHICQALSWILVPLLMPVYGLMLAFGFSSLDALPFSTKFSFTAVAFIFNALVPMLLVVVLKRFGLVQDLGLNGRKERLVPYIISIVALGATAVFLEVKHAPSWLWLFYIGGAAAGVVNFAVNFFWKISAHAAGIAGLVALLVELCRYQLPYPPLVGWTVAAVLSAGMLGSARIWMGRHTLGQVLAGYAVGFLGVYLTGLLA